MKLRSLAVLMAAALVGATAFSVNTASAQAGFVRQAPQNQSSERSRLSDREMMQQRETGEREITDRRTRDRRGRAPSAEEINQRAHTALASAGVTCDVSAANLVGVTGENNDLIEVACNSGVGYLVENARPARTFDCLTLASQADRLRAEGQPVPENSTCTLPGNQNGLAVMAAYATEAGVPCQIDAGKIAGRTQDGNTVYEVGCPGADGYHIERQASGWKRTDCLEVMGTGLQCDFSTPEEQATGIQPLLAGTAIDDCSAQAVRLLASNADGRYVEIKCAAGDGYVAIVKDNAVAQVVPCRAAARVGGGCTLTRSEG